MKRIIVFVVFFVPVCFVKAQNANCSPPTSSIDLDINNVRAVISNSGDFWMNRTAKEAGYEIPKGSRIHSMYAGGLWFGGVDNNGQLKLAAQRYRSNGEDFWPGPISMGTAQTNAANCAKYDRHYKTTSAEIEHFKVNYSKPNYVIPEVILNWPAHGDVSKGEAPYLAPFLDMNGNGIYEPHLGDHPDYTKANNQVCGNTLLGHQNIWWIFNDKGNTHTETGGLPIGLEVHAQAFAFATNDEINNATFYHFKFINRSSIGLHNTYAGIWADPDLGRYDDDYVGCDVSRGLGYCYNGYPDDGTGAYGEYGAKPPAIGIDILRGPFMDADGMDNPLVANYAQAFSGNGIPYPGLGFGFGDGIIDNERPGMARFLYHNHSGSGSNLAITDPTVSTEYYNYLRGIWKDNTPVRYGGNGHPSGGGNGVICNYMFPGETDPLGWGTGGTVQYKWTEESEGNVPYDRRFLMSSGPFTFAAGAVNSMMLGVIWARDPDGDNFTAITKLQAADDKAQQLADECFESLMLLSITENTPINNSFSVFPNPMVDYTDVYFSSQLQVKEYKIQVFGMDGKLVHEGLATGDKYKINRNGLPAGAYFIRVLSADGKVDGTRKIVVY